MIKRTKLANLRVVVENLRFAFHTLGSHRLRAALTVTGIVIGVTTVIVMVGVIQGYRASLVASMTSYGATLVQFQKYEPRFGGGRERPAHEKERRNLTLADAMAIKELCPSIRAVSPERWLFPFQDPTPVRARGREANSPFIAGIVPDYQPANNHYVIDGRFITDADVLYATQVAVIADDVTQALFPDRDPIGRSMEIGGRRYEIVGVFERKGSGMGGSQDNYVMIPFSSFDRQFPWVKRSGDTIHIATLPRGPELVQQAIEEGTAVLRVRRKLRPDQPNDFAIYTPQKLLDQTQGMLNAVGAVLTFIASIALMVGGVGVMNVMLAAVTQRTREIGVRMALGARRSDITQQFLIEATLLTGLGGAIGVGIALAVVMLIRQATPIPAIAPAWTIAVGLAVSLSVGIFFGLYPATRAARLDPIDALRHE